MSGTTGAKKNVKIETHSEAMDYLYKKYFEMLEEPEEVIEIKRRTPSTKKTEAGAEVPCVKLLKDTDPIVYLDAVEGDAADWVKPSKRLKIDVKRRIIEPDHIDENEKLRLASVDGTQVLEKNDTKLWKNRKNDDKRLFEYKEKNSALHLIEKPIGYILKNSWEECKIAKRPIKKKGPKRYIGTNEYETPKSGK